MWAARSRFVADRVERTFSNVRLQGTVIVDSIFDLNESTRVRACGEVPQADIARERSEEGNSGADEYWNPGNDEPLHQSGCQECLNRLSSVEVDVGGTPIVQSPHDVRRRAGHRGNGGRKLRGDFEWAPCQHHGRLVAIGPFAERSYYVKRASSHHESVH